MVLVPSVHGQSATGPKRLPFIFYRPHNEVCEGYMFLHWCPVCPHGGGLMRNKVLFRGACVPPVLFGGCLMVSEKFGKTTHAPVVLFWGAPPRGFIRGACPRGFIQGACPWFYSGGAPQILPRTPPHKTMVLPPNKTMHAPKLFGGHAWFYSGGACVVLPRMPPE